MWARIVAVYTEINHFGKTQTRTFPEMLRKRSLLNPKLASLLGLV